MTRAQLQQLLGQQNQAGLKSDLDVLNERELEVFSIMGLGYSAAQVQAEFGIAPTELKRIKRVIQKKLGFKDEVQLLRYAVKKAKD